MRYQFACGPVARAGVAPGNVPPEFASPASTPGGTLAKAFVARVEDNEFPCVGAKAALAQGGLQTAEFAALGWRGNDAPLLDRLIGFADELDASDAESSKVNSFTALFEGPVDADERRFEALLWSQLQRLHTLDASRGTPWAADVSIDPDSPQFSLSLGGHPFFVIGLHPGASRLARRFAWPALVFNSHRQFDRLRADGRYAKMQAATRARDTALQGSINPNLADFGTAAETRQYSGREVGPEWHCPFHVMRTR